MKHAVEFVHEEGDGFMAFIRRDGGVQIGAVNADVAFGGETVGDGLSRIAFEFDADADDAFFVAEQAFRFFTHESFEGWSEFEVDAGDDQFVLIGMSVHVTLVCCWID